MNFEDINAIAGIAALLNSMILVPTVRSMKAAVEALKTIAQDHGVRLDRLERKTKARPRKRARE